MIKLFFIVLSAFAFANANAFLSFTVKQKIDDLYMIERADELFLLGGCNKRHGTMIHLIEREDGSYDVPLVEDWTLLENREQDERAWSMCLELGYR